MKKTRQLFYSLLVIEIVSSLIFSPINTSVLAINSGEYPIDFEFNHYFGSDGNDFINSVTHDSQNNLIIGGSVFYPIADTGISGPASFYQGPFWDRDREIFDEFPIVNGADKSYGGANEGVLAKLNNDGEFIWSTYIGGVMNDYVKSVAVNSLDEIVVGGETRTKDLFNRLEGNTFKGIQDGFVSKYESNGTHLWTIYIGGEGSEVINSITFDLEDNIIITGYTLSNNFPNTISSLVIESDREDNPDAYVMKLSPNGDILWSTIIGGFGYDYAYDVTINSLNEIIIAGWTTSANFPIKNAHTETFQGKNDMFVSTFSPDGELVWSSYFGGYYIDIARSIEVDSRDNLVIVGYTYSTNFLHTEIPFAKLNENGNDAVPDTVVFKLNRLGSMIWSQFFGGNNADEATSVVLDGNDNIYISGRTTSINYPLYANISQAPPFNNNYGQQDVALNDAVITKLSPDGEMMFSVYYGGEDSDRGIDIDINLDDNVIIVGYTTSRTFPLYDATTSYALANVFISMLSIKEGFHLNIDPIINQEDTDKFQDQLLTQIIFGIFLTYFTFLIVQKYRNTRRKRIFKKSSNITYLDTHDKILEIDEFS